MKIAIDSSPLISGHKVRGSGYYLKNLKKSLLDLNSEEVLIFFEKKLPNEKVDLIHYPYFDPFFITLPLLKKQKRIVTVHDLTPIIFEEHFPRGLKGEIKWKIQRRSLLDSDAIITDSQNSKEDITKILGFPEEKIFVIYLAASEIYKPKDSEIVSREISKFHLPEKFALYVGDVTWNKNLPNLVEAIKRIKVPLVMVGKALSQNDFDEKNPWNSDLLKVNEMIKGESNFIKLGFVSDEELVNLYNSATLLTMPSLYEGFGLPIIEAMSCGCPVVTSDRGSLKEVSGDGAYFVDPDSVSSIAKGIGTVFSSNDIQKKLSKMGILQSSKFSWEKTANDTMNVYKKIIKNE